MVRRFYRLNEEIDWAEINRDFTRNDKIVKANPINKQISKLARDYGFELVGGFFQGPGKNLFLTMDFWPIKGEHRFINYISFDRHIMDFKIMLQNVSSPHGIDTKDLSSLVEDVSDAEELLRQVKRLPLSELPDINEIDKD